MYNFSLLMLAVGMIASLVTVAVYLWKCGRLTYSSWSQCAGLGLLLGLAAEESICLGKVFVSLIISGYIIYFIYLKEYSEKNIKNENMMLSLVAGVVIGVSGLIGCAVYR